MPKIKDESKQARGGKRKGAGRKPCTISGIVKQLPDGSAKLLLAEIKANTRLIQLAQSEDENVSLQTIKFLWEHAYGKAPQTLNVNHSTFDGGARLAELLAGGITAAHQLPAVGRA